MAQSEAQSTVQKWNRNCQEHSINSNDALVTLCVKAFETAAIVLSPTSDKAHVDYALTTLRIDREIALQFEKEGFDVLRHLSFGLIETLQVLLEVKGKNNEDSKEEPMEIMREENQMPIVDDHMGEEEIEEITEEEEPQVKKPRIKSEKKINNKRREYGEKQYSCPKEECEYITHSIVQWYKHLTDRHKSRPRELGLALLCECGNESFSSRHSVQCDRANITIVRKSPTPACFVVDCQERPKTASGYAQHARMKHGRTIMQAGIFLVCSCGTIVRHEEDRAHATEECTGHEYTLHMDVEKQPAVADAGTPYERLDATVPVRERSFGHNNFREPAADPRDYSPAHPPQDILVANGSLASSANQVPGSTLGMTGLLLDDTGSRTADWLGRPSLSRDSIAFAEAGAARVAEVLEEALAIKPLIVHMDA